jgi:hypothetical protein
MRTGLNLRTMSWHSRDHVRVRCAPARREFFRKATEGRRPLASRLSGRRSSRACGGNIARRREFWERQMQPATPSLRAKRSNPCHTKKKAGLLRRYAPRNDEMERHADCLACQKLTTRSAVEGIKRAKFTRAASMSAGAGTRFGPSRSRIKARTVAHSRPMVLPTIRIGS